MEMKKNLLPIKNFICGIIYNKRMAENTDSQYNKSMYWHEFLHWNLQHRD